MTTLNADTPMRKSYQRLYNATAQFDSDWKIQSTSAFREFQAAFGSESVLFLLGELQHHPTRMAMLLLENITGENPVPVPRRGGPPWEVAKYWVKWGLSKKGRF